MKAWIDGTITDAKDARVPLLDHGLLYGDGVFEGIRVYNGKVFKLAEHVARLYDSARAILLDIPMPPARMSEIIEEAVRRSGLTEAYIRPIVTRGVGDLGIDPRKCPTPTVMVIVDSIKIWPAERYEQGLVAVTAGTPIAHRESLSPRVKSLNYLAHILAKIEGNLAGADEIIMLDASGHVAEGSGQNLFLVKGGVIKTPPPHAGILLGVTREVVMDLARQAGHQVTEAMLNRYDIYTADEVFLTGTASEVVPVRQLDGRIIGGGSPGPITRDLMTRFKAYARS